MTEASQRREEGVRPLEAAGLVVALSVLAGLWAYDRIQDRGAWRAVREAAAAAHGFPADLQDARARILAVDPPRALDDWMPAEDCGFLDNPDRHWSACALEDRPGLRVAVMPDIGMNARENAMAGLLRVVAPKAGEAQRDAALRMAEAAPPGDTGTLVVGDARLTMERAPSGAYTIYAEPLHP